MDQGGYFARVCYEYFCFNKIIDMEIAITWGKPDKPFQIEFELVKIKCDGSKKFSCGDNGGLWGVKKQRSIDGIK